MILDLAYITVLRQVIQRYATITASSSQVCDGLSVDLHFADAKRQNGRGVHTTDDTSDGPRGKVPFSHRAVSRAGEEDLSIACQAGSRVCVELKTVDSVGVALRTLEDGPAVRTSSKALDELRVSAMK